MAKGKWRRTLAAWWAALAVASIVACGGGGSANPLVPTAARETVDPGSSERPTVAGGEATPGAPPVVVEAASALREGRYTEAAVMYKAIAAASEDPRIAAEGWLGAGVATFEGGAPEKAIELLQRAVDAAPPGSGVARRAAYLLARRLDEAGDFARARTVLEKVVRLPGDVLQPYLDAELGIARAGLGERAAAALAWDAALAAAGVSEPLKAAVYQARAEDALAAADTADAAGWLQRLVTLGGGPEERYVLASLAAEAGDWGTFEQQLVAIIREEPASDYAVLAVDDLRAAGMAVDGGSEGYVYYRRRSFAQAREVLAEAVLEPGIASSALAFRTYYLAASYEDAGFLAEAVPLYDQVPEIDPSSPYAHRARYWAARATEGVGDTAGASQRYLALALDGQGGEFTSEAAFRAGYVLLAGGDAAGALDMWARVPAGSDARLLYWMGRAREALGDTEGARAAYGDAREAGPYSLHGQEAGRLLGAVAEADVSYQGPGEVLAMDWGEVARWLGGEDAQAPGALETAAGELAAIGLRHEAADLLYAEAAEREGVGLVAVLREAYEAGLGEVAARLTATLLTESPGRPWEAPRSVLQLAYPLDYAVRLEQAARGADVDSLLLAALIRQESFWDPAAVSIAGAMGLAQVMPDTGEGIAAAIGPDGWRPGDLLRPAVSLAFGAYYLGVQLGRFGSAHAALAAYNAGPGNAVEWQEAAAGGSPADFVEGVDISETRDYVEQVLEHYAYYQLIYRRHG